MFTNTLGGSDASQPTDAQFTLCLQNLLTDADAIAKRAVSLLNAWQARTAEIVPRPTETRSSYNLFIGTCPDHDPGLCTFRVDWRDADSLREFLTTCQTARGAMADVVRRYGTHAVHINLAGVYRTREEAIDAGRRAQIQHNVEGRLR